MRTASAKAKGRRPMLWLRERLLATFPQLQPDDVRVTASGTPGPDLQLSPAAQQVFPYAVESKCCEALNIWAALRQAETHMMHMMVTTPHPPDGVRDVRFELAPVVVFTRNRTKTYVALEAESFLDLVRRAAK